MPSCANHPDVITGLGVCTSCGGTFCSSCYITLQGRTICAGCKGSTVQDIKSNVTDDLELAGTGTRFAAQFIDGMLMMVVFFVTAFAFTAATGGKGGNAMASTIMTLVLLPLVGFTTYEALMLQHRGGQTLGKMACKIRVVRVDGGELGAGQCWGRALARVLLQITRIGGLIDALMIFSENRATLHDRMAKTRVINWRR